MEVRILCFLSGTFARPLLYQTPYIWTLIKGSWLRVHGSGLTLVKGYIWFMVKGSRLRVNGSWLMIKG